MGAYSFNQTLPVGGSNAQPFLAATGTVLRSLQQIAELNLQVIKTCVVENQAFADKLSRVEKGGDQFALYVEAANQMPAKLTAYGDQLRTIMGAAGDSIRDTSQASLGSARDLAGSAFVAPSKASLKPHASSKQ